MTEDERINAAVLHQHYMDAWFGRHSPGWWVRYVKSIGYDGEHPDRLDPNPDKGERSSRSW